MPEHATDPQRTSKLALLWLTALAVPVAVGVETLLRRLVLPPSFDELRAEIGPAANTAAWVLAAFSVAAAAVSSRVQHVLAHRAVERLSAEARALPQRVSAARLGAFLLSSSIVQIPALLATVAYMLGASLVPIAVGLVAVTAAIALQARNVDGA